MSINPRRKRSFKKIAAYILFLLIFGSGIVALNLFLASQKPLYISPLGKAGITLAIVEKSLQSKNIAFSKVTPMGNVYVVTLKNSGLAELSRDKDISQQTASLQRILNQLTIEGKSFKMIDFRFSEPIISF